MKGKLKIILINTALLLTSVIIAFVIGEGIIRIFDDPVNYLQAEVIKDDILNYKIAPNSAGHDDWGFRNKSIPASVTILTIGDSHTYGVSAKSENSWPSLLGKLSQKSVYNMGHGGYDPIKYVYLLEKYGLQLNPSIIFVGFYYGNDIRDAYNTVYGIDHWKYLRKTYPQINKDSSGYTTQLFIRQIAMKEQQLAGVVRKWMAHNSCLYRLAAFTVGDFFRFYEMKYFYPDTTITLLEDNDNNIFTGFNPIQRLYSLNLELPEIKEGLRLSLNALVKMSEICKDNNIFLVVVLIPSKESVYADYLKDNKQLKHYEYIYKVLANENELNSKVKTFLSEHGIDYIDVLPPLQKACGDRLIYPNNHGDHTNKEGYLIIANSIKKYLSDNKLLN